jgi:hypothetical protein
MKVKKDTGPRRRSEDEDPALRRIQQDRLPGELETAMLSGSENEGDFYIEDRFGGEMTREEALRALSAPTPTEEEEARTKKARAPSGRKKTEK